MGMERIGVIIKGFEKRGLKYDFDLCRWYTEGKRADGSVKRIFIPPFGITDEMLLKRLKEFGKIS